MASAERLMGLGMPAELAKRLGFFIVETVTDGLPHTYLGPGNIYVVVSAATSSIVLDDSFDIGDQVYIEAHAAASVYPGTLSYIWPTSVGAVHAVTADVSRIFTRTGATSWGVVTSV